MAKPLVVTWRGDISDLQTKGKQAEQTVARVGSSAMSSADVLKRGFTEAGHSVSALSPLLDGAAGRLSGFAGVVTGGGLGPAVGAISAIGTALTGFVTKGVEDYTHLAEQVRGLTLVTGESATAMSGWIAVGHSQGVAADDIRSAFARLAPNIEDSAKKLADHGVQVTRNSDGSVNLSETLRNLSDMFANGATRTQADAAAKVALGRSYASLLPLLTTSRDAQQEIIDQAGQAHMILNDDDIAKAHQFQVEMREAGVEAKGFGVEVAKDIVPTLGDAALGFTKVLQGADNLANGMKGIMTSLGPFEGFLKAVSTSPLTILADIGGVFRKNAVDTASATGATGDYTDTAEDAATMTDKLRQAIITQNNAQEQMAQSQRRVSQAEQDLADKRRSTVAAETQAQQEEERSAQRVADAEDHLRDVEDKLNDVTSRSGQYATDLAHARSGLEHSTLGQTEAEHRLLAAQQQLQQALGSGDLSQLLSAQDALKEAQLGVGDAAQSHADAQDSLTKLQNQAIPGTKEYEQNQRDLRDATNQLSDAQAAHAAAQQKVIDSFSQASQTIAQAQQAVSDAKNAELTAGLQLQDATDKERQAFEKYPSVLDAVMGKFDELKGQFPDIAAGLDSVTAHIPSWMLPDAAGTPPALAAARQGVGGPLADQLAQGDTSSLKQFGNDFATQVFGPPQVNITVQGSVIHENDLGQVVHDQLLKVQRRSGSLGWG